MVELADTLDLESSAARRESSNLSTRTNKKEENMAVIVQNITSEDKLYDNTADHDYEVRINQKHIVYFKHRRDEGLAVCLRRAADAIDAEEIPIHAPPFKRNKFVTPA